MNIVILAQPTAYADAIIKNLVKERRKDVRAIVISKAVIQGKPDLKAALDLWGITGTRLFLLKALDLFFFKADLKKYGLPVYETRNINSALPLEYLKSLNPDIIISVFFNQILKKDAFTLATKLCLNIHPSYLPAYRGVGPVVWALGNNEKETGVTIHKISEGIDNGEIVAQAKVGIGEFDTVNSLYMKCAEKAAGLLADVLDRVQRGGVFTRGAQTAGGTSYFSFPDKALMKKFTRNGKKFFTCLEAIKGLKARFLSSRA